MRKTNSSDSMIGNSSRRLRHALRLSAVALGIGLLMTSHAVRAQDDEDDDKTFEEKIIDNLMRGMGAVSMDNSGIDYRERSPLVVPPKLDLPPPVSSKAEVKAPNWPKDPDEARRKAAAAARKKSKPSPEESARLLTPTELNKGKTIAETRANNDPMQPGATNNPSLSPSQLGFDGKLSTLFGGKGEESAKFQGEPSREALTQPPPGYQTPSPNYPYGTGPQQPLGAKNYNVMTGKEE